MRIITISREFGSGGREFGKRLSDVLGYDYYDKEIITCIADRMKLDENYVHKMSEKTLVQNFPITFGRTIGHYPIIDKNATEILNTQRSILLEIAEKQRNCVIVGRSADIILREYKPFNIFIYADMYSKIKRCMERESNNQGLTEKQLKKAIKSVDIERARYCELLVGEKWGNKEKYHLCINTSSCSIKDLVFPIAEYINVWFK